MRSSINLTLTGIFLLFSSFIFAQSMQTVTSGSSPTVSIDGSNYQGYCVEYTNTAPGSGANYSWDDTQEDINLTGVTACLQGQSQYGVDAVQRAVWYFTDNVNPPSGHNAWTIISNVENGVYSDQCASEWYPHTSGLQDLMTQDDPHCISNGVQVTINNKGKCPVDIYWWVNTGDVYYQTIQAGNSWSVNTTPGHKWRATSSPTDWNNLQFDESYMATNDAKQSWNISPDYCGGGDLPPIIDCSGNGSYSWDSNLYFSGTSYTSDAHLICGGNISYTFNLPAEFPCRWNHDKRT